MERKPRVPLGLQALRKAGVQITNAIELTKREPVNGEHIKSVLEGVMILLEMADELYPKDESEAGQ